MDEKFDVMIIGGGVVGSATARELSRYKLKIGVLEKALDVVDGASGRNTGLLHSGILYKKNLLKTECCIEGNKEFEKIAKELDVPFKRCGKLIVGFGDTEKKRLLELYDRGLENGVQGLRIIDRDEIKKIEPNVDGDWAIYVPSAGILCPFTYTIALAENAAQNGVKYYFDHEVKKISKMSDDLFCIHAGKDIFMSRWVINCAGLYAYKVSEMLGFEAYKPNRVKGEYEILDKKAGKYLSMPVYPTPNKNGEFDVHVTPTIDGNVLVGPTIENIGDKIDYTATQKKIDELNKNGAKMFSYVKREYFIRNYAGVFPTIEDKNTHKEMDYRIETKEDIANAINVVGINSPGLTSAMPIARRIAEKIKMNEELVLNECFNPIRHGIVKFSEQSVDGKRKLIEENPDYGEIYCRCECVTKAEVKQAIHNILGVSTVSGIKYRTRATMGRCQGGYCETRLTKMIQDELGKNKKEVLLNKNGAYMFTGEVK